MSWVRVFVHAVFSTKNRYPYLRDISVRNKLIVHIKENAKVKNIWLDSIGGYSEHMHCLISLNKDISIKDTIQLIKGESSHWINASKSLKEKFNWQDDYWMVGVSESHITQVRNYIENQNVHHIKKSFKQEIDEFMIKYGWEIIKD